MNKRNNKKQNKTNNKKNNKKKNNKNTSKQEEKQETEETYPKVVHLTILDEVVQALSRPYGKPKVSVLNCSGGLCGDDLAGRIATGMQKNPRGIEELVLVENLLGPRSGERLALGIIQSRSLIKLNLSQNTLGDRGLTALCTALLTNNTLTALNVASNSIGSTHDGAWIQTLSQVLSKKKIKILDISDNLFGYQDILQIVESFHSPTCNLIYLNLSMNPIGDIGIESLGLAILNGEMVRRKRKSREIDNLLIYFFVLYVNFFSRFFFRAWYGTHMVLM